MSTRGQIQAHEIGWLPSLIVELDMAVFRWYSGCPWSMDCSFAATFMEHHPSKLHQKNTQRNEYRLSVDDPFISLHYVRDVPGPCGISGHTRVLHVGHPCRWCFAAGLSTGALVPPWWTVAIPVVTNGTCWFKWFLRPYGRGLSLLHTASIWSGIYIYISLSALLIWMCPSRNMTAL